VIQLVHTPAELDAARAQLPGTVGLVPTMGALHRGHQALIDTARRECDSVVVSIFVNPMQFNQAADLERYPRTLDADVALASAAGADLVFNPTVEAVYPDGPAQVWVTAGALADQLEGPNRPGHFDGVLTVVTKLFALVRPHRAYFGEKDYQQLTLIRRMVADLGQPVHISAVSTVRDEDGLALSSRNVFLSASERDQALALPRALHAAQQASGTAAAALAAAHGVLDTATGVEVEYLQVRSDELTDAAGSGPARLLVAARVGSVRLIDNIALHLGAPDTGGPR
jgi:pantoate--beta-alanine ligase